MVVMTSNSFLSITLPGESDGDRIPLDQGIIKNLHLSNNDQNKPITYVRLEK